MAGRFVSIDGIDGCGKSTQIELLSSWLKQQQKEICVVRDPGGTKLGEALREILLHKQEIPLAMRAEMLLYMASRAQLVSEVIEPALSEGKFVIADRFLLANVVYQGSGGGLDPSLIWRVGEIATNGRVPDRTILLNLTAEQAQERLDNSLDRLESRGVDYMRHVQEGFLSESQKLGDRVSVLDATLSVDSIHSNIQRLMEPLL